MKNYVISEEVLNTLLQYLIAKPYAEVSACIQALTNLPTANIVPTMDETPITAESIADQNIIGTSIPEGTPEVVAEAPVETPADTAPEVTEPVLDPSQEVPQEVPQDSTPEVTPDTEVIAADQQ